MDQKVLIFLIFVLSFKILFIRIFMVYRSTGTEFKDKYFGKWSMVPVCQIL